MEQFLNVPIDKVIQSETNPRKHFDQKQMADLKESVQAKGIINPILVRPLIAGCYEIVAGERRWRTAKALKLETVPVLVRELTDEQALEIQVIENLQRADVHPLDEAAGYKQLMDRNKYDQQAIADKVGKSVVYVYQRLQLLSLIDPIKKIFWDDAITVTHAIHIARLSPDNQQLVLKEVKESIQYRGGAPSIKSLNDFIHRNVFLDLNKALWKKEDAELDPNAGACSQCPKRTGFNKSLFPDMAKQDMCLDKECFKKKTQLHIQQKIEKTEEEKGCILVKVSSEYRPDDKKLMGCMDYYVASKTIADAGKAKMAIVVDGNEAGKIIYIQTRKDEAQKGGGLSESEKLQRAETRVKNQEREQERKFRIRLLKEVSEKINTTLTSDDLRDIAAQLMRSINSSERSLIKEHYGMIGTHEYRNDDLTAYRSELPKTDFELAKLLMLLALGSCLYGEYSLPSSANLLAAAARYGINHKAIKSQTQKEFPIKMPKILLEEKPATKAKQKKGGKSKK